MADLSRNSPPEEGEIVVDTPKESAIDGEDEQTPRSTNNRRQVQKMMRGRVVIANVLGQFLQKLSSQSAFKFRMILLDIQVGFAINAPAK